MGAITIVGTGWTAGELTLGAIQALSSGDRVILHTDRCGCAGWLSEKGIAFESLDDLYERCEDFDEHARAAADAVLAAAKAGDVVYAVADIRDRSVQLLADCAARIVAGPPSEGALMAFARGETRAVAAADWEDFHLTARENCLIRELESRELAAEVKLKLMEVYPEESEVLLLRGGEAPARAALFELDRADRYDHRTCVLVPAQRSITRLERYDFEHLNEIMRILCAPDGCPWDRAQTHKSLRPSMLEEAYEVIAAIDEEDTDHLYDELGDVLLQVAIHAEIARRHGEFDISDVTTAICEKMIRRHTHIFGEDRVDDPEQVVELWGRNKMSERSQRTHAEALRDITPTLPALLRAVKVFRRSGDAGLREDDAAAVAGRCAGKVAGVVGAADVEAALGEALFDLSELSGMLGVDPEIALNAAANRFIARFEDVERELREKGDGFEHLDAQTLRKYWNLVKL